jgi:uncharacterized protein YigE (DUF2233 family)
MKRTFFIGFALTLILLGIAAWQIQGLATDLTELHPGIQRQLEPTAAAAAPTDEPERQSVTFGGITYAYAFAIIDASKLILIPNFDHPIGASTLAETSGCVKGINAGFYTKETTPLGLWKNGSETRGTFIRSDLVNAVVAKKASLFSISDASPEDADFAFQAGPRLISASIPHTLTINNDEPARRSITAVSVDGQSIFLSVYRQGSLYDGPKLADLPKVLVAITTKESLTIRDAVNLDGGSASFYKDSSRTISELVPIGSMMCETK